MKLILFIGVFLALVAGVWMNRAGISGLAPKFTARAVYSINWNQIGLGDAKYNAREARRDYDRQLAILKVSRAFARELCQACNLPLCQAATISSRLQHGLKVSRVDQVNGDDVYRIQCSDNNQLVASKAVNLLAQRLGSVIHIHSTVQDEEQASLKLF